MKPNFLIRYYRNSSSLVFAAAATILLNIASIHAGFYPEASAVPDLGAAAGLVAIGLYILLIYVLAAVYIVAAVLRIFSIGAPKDGQVSRKRQVRLGVGLIVIQIVAFFVNDPGGLDLIVGLFPMVFGLTLILMPGAKPPKAKKRGPKSGQKRATRKPAIQTQP